MIVIGEAPAAADRRATSDPAAPQGDKMYARWSMVGGGVVRPCPAVLVLMMEPTHFLKADLWGC
jgi:hypothetical protein